ncbi:MAG TPA: hypothetical protein VL943_15355 [Niabella sp.]|nr:hypothetical protein [Niabella sp.]
MKSKEEILDGLETEIFEGDYWLPRTDVTKAMSEYASHVSVGFAEWLENESWKEEYAEQKTLTIKEKFTQYLKTIEQC